MIDLSIGVDIVSIERMENILNSQKGTRFKQRIFTGSEITYCQNRGRNASQHFAGRFAAKEAVKKLYYRREIIKVHGLKKLKFYPGRMVHP